MNRYAFLVFIGLSLHIHIGLALSKAIFVNTSDKLWPGAVIPYKMDPGLSTVKKNEILLAMAVWESQTVIHFLALNADNEKNYNDYILFRPSEGKSCFSAVGRQHGEQVIRLAARCHTMSIAHELGHAIGLWHEQSRWDRDAYVEVVWENIQEDHLYNFNQRLNEGQDIGEYDYDSIMHYSAYAFSKNGQPTLIPRQKSFQIGQRTHLSAGDIASVNALYAKEKEKVRAK